MCAVKTERHSWGKEEKQPGWGRDLTDSGRTMCDNTLCFVCQQYSEKENMFPIKNRKFHQELGMEAGACLAGRALEPTPNTAQKKKGQRHFSVYIFYITLYLIVSCYIYSDFPNVTALSQQGRASRVVKLLQFGFGPSECNNSTPSSGRFPQKNCYISKIQKTLIK